MTKQRKYYDILGVSMNATETDIKKAFRSKAKACHPDHHPGDAVKETAFKELSIAYGVLSDPAARRHYDENGEAPSIDDILTKAYGIIIETFQKIRQQEGDQVLYMDPIERMKEIFSDGTCRAHAEIMKLKSWNERNDKLLKKIIHKKGDKTSFIHLALADENSRNEQEIQSIEHAIAVMKKATEILDEYRFEPDKRKDRINDRRRGFVFPGGVPDFETVFDRRFGFTQDPKS